MKQFIDVELIMLSDKKGGRIQPIDADAFGGNYRPHIVIGDPNQRNAVLIEKDGHKRYIDEDYQGVAFWSGPEQIPVGSMIKVVLALMYYPEHEYKDVIPGATFTVREGSKIVGFGRVISRRGGT
jgi:hypothetical protein